MSIITPKVQHVEKSSGVLNGDLRNSSSTINSADSHIENIMKEKVPAINGINGTSETYSEWNQGPGFVRRPLKVRMVGAGFAGLAAAQAISTKFADGDINFKIYEKNEALGGTWFENRYPGCACDIPAHLYALSWAPNPAWSSYYAPSSEILQYMNRVADKFDLKKYMKFSHKLIEVVWDEKRAKYDLKFEVNTGSGSTIVEDDCDVFLQGTGVLNRWKWPEIEGLHDFKGRLFHTANWDTSFDFTDKTVAVIGNGASAVQCVAGMQPTVKHLYNFVRSPTWMLPHIFSENGEVQRQYSKEDLQKFCEDEDYYFHYRLKLEAQIQNGFLALRRGTKEANALRDILVERTTKMVKDPAIRKTMLPEFEPGCRRFTPGDHYIHAVQQPNVSITDDPILKVTSTGILTKSGNHHEVDAIVSATGFDTTFEPRYRVIGRDGFDLKSNWSDGAECESYMSSTVAHMPNFFCFSPPITPVLGSGIPGLERTADYVCRVLDRVQTQGIRTVCVKQSAQTKFNEWAQSRMSQLVFTSTCRNAMKTKEGKIHIPWPGILRHFYKATEIIRWEDYDIDYLKPDKEFDYLGNGFVEEGFEWIDPFHIKKGNHL